MDAGDQVEDCGQYQADEDLCTDGDEDGNVSSSIGEVSWETAEW
jgi:hypothetical protein